MRRFLQSLALVAAVAACSTTGAHAPDAQASAEAAAHQAQRAYVEAINSNKLDAVMDMLTEDIVFLAPNEPALIGKAAVGAWAQGYLEAFKIHWEKQTMELIVSGDWAIEYYAYRSYDVPLAGGPAVRDAGKGINIYRRDAHGRWRVARDAWNSDLPVAAR